MKSSGNWRSETLHANVSAPVYDVVAAQCKWLRSSLGEYIRKAVMNQLQDDSPELFRWLGVCEERRDYLPQLRQALEEDEEKFQKWLKEGIPF